MRKSSILGIGALLLTSVLVGSPAGAGLLPITGTLSVHIEFPNLNNVAPIDQTLPSAGAAVAQVNASGPPGHLSSASLAGGIFSTVGFVQPPLTPSGFVKGVKVTAANGAGAFTPMGGLAFGFGGIMPIIGGAKICLLQGCNSTSPLPLLLTLPLSAVGAGGNATVINGGFTFMVHGARWTTGTITAGATVMGVPLFSATGSRMGPLGAMSSTANASGMVNLVTPFRITSSLGTGFDGYGFARLELHFVPEPHLGSLVLAGAGLLWFATRKPAKECSVVERDRSGA